MAPARFPAYCRAVKISDKPKPLTFRGFIAGVYTACGKQKAGGTLRSAASASQTDVRGDQATADLCQKRTLDALLIFLLLPFLIPLALVVSLLIRSVSRGPILFRQERVGRRGRRFTCFKFRTMFVHCDTDTHQEHLHQLMNANTPMMKMDSRGDSRIIPLGRWLRASGLDELPQLINVLRGEMSLVGPRPCLPYEYEKYLPWQKERFETVPGLTGLWQVSGKNKTTFVEMIELDIKYARNKTVGRDLQIILLTVPAVINQMWETRRARKPTVPGTARPALDPETAAPRVVQAGEDNESWMGSEANLNL
jgi:lipopolysaccharide/colanic/teichoic acid biosynthesis glycosyltransferase